MCQLPVIELWNHPLFAFDIAFVYLCGKPREGSEREKSRHMSLESLVGRSSSRCANLCQNRDCSVRWVFDAE